MNLVRWITFSIQTMKLCKGFINIVHLLMHEEKLITTVPYNYSIYDSQNPFARLGIKKKKKIK